MALFTAPAAAQMAAAVNFYIMHLTISLRRKIK